VKTSTAEAFELYWNVLKINKIASTFLLVYTTRRIDGAR
jgi:hypothetical protein